MGQAWVLALAVQAGLDVRADRLEVLAVVVLQVEAGLVDLREVREAVAPAEAVGLLAARAAVMVVPEAGDRAVVGIAEKLKAKVSSQSVTS